ncbi:MAG TPA: formate--tetrahydrofolate ligase [Ktedonosporobacter sp.]|jgi:hypothetical protein|nr:formate--tetrahydrofolate ligase [Ktedonosporobacter sp.]
MACNLIKQIENARAFGLPVVVTINRFTHDHGEDIAVIKRIAVEAGAEGAYVSNLWADGSNGGMGSRPGQETLYCPPLVRYMQRPAQLAVHVMTHPGELEYAETYERSLVAVVSSTGSAEIT